MLLIDCYLSYLGEHLVQFVLILETKISKALLNTAHQKGFYDFCLRYSIWLLTIQRTHNKTKIYKSIKETSSHVR